MEITLSDGYIVTIDEEALDDWELFEAICSLDEGNTAVLPKILKAMLSESEIKALKEHLREKNGKVKSSDMISALSEILSGANGNAKK